VNIGNSHIDRGPNRHEITCLRRVEQAWGRPDQVRDGGHAV